MKKCGILLHVAGLLAMLVLAGCSPAGAENEMIPVSKETLADTDPVSMPTATPKPTATAAPLPTPTPEIVYVEKEVEKEVIKEVEKEVIKEVEKEVIKEVVTTRVIYSDDILIDTYSSLKSSFRDSLGSEESEYNPVWLGHDRNLLVLLERDMGEEFDDSAITMSTTDPEVAVIDGHGNVRGLKEGTCEIIFKIPKGNGRKKAVEKRYKIYVTTFNDGRDPKTYQAKYGSTEGFIMDGWLVMNGTWVKENINTIQDLIFTIKTRGIWYDAANPASMDSLADGWTWAQDGNATFIMGKGVCCDICNAAAFALQYDYEDQGVVYITGNNGHVFNWFYEDGKYIVCDFTAVIADVRDGYDGWDYVQIYDTPEEMKKALVARYVLEDQTFNMFMVSSFGHDFIPAIYIADYCHDSSSVNSKSVARVGVEPMVYNNLTVLYENKRFPGIRITEIPYSEIPYDVPVYGQHERMSADTSGRYKGSRYTGPAYDEYR